MSFLEENDENGEIASGDKPLGTSLFDNDDDDETTVDNSDSADGALAEEESVSPQPHSFSSQYLSRVKAVILKDIEDHGRPRCYKNGDFFIRAKHPCFALQHAGAKGFAPEVLYERDVFVWLPDLLVAKGTSFYCHCGKKMSKNGMDLNISTMPSISFPL
jgi:hypothetical protein